ncbi:short-chain dehydrogenase [Halarchaeum grantii]|uniref:Short-chain dehydrogenase n=1 Tax=Halarchaeum grantii TaxID=1193105 RepID=A0A830F4Z7_9EURY|nr:SDR family NAD(P)-dependent oxidoreductase [Halarchaeum grantii]GGL21605.1 short-chain dehydrogenase [Halarchaeum grantii]
MTRTAVVAGVGPGLGASLARKFAREGCRVALFARSTDYIEDLADDLPDPGEGLAVTVDLTDVEAIREAFETVREEFGPVDVLVNHASAASWTGLMDSSVEEFERAWEVNGRGAFVCSQEAVGDMLDDEGGTVLFTGATSAVRSRGGAIGFTAAKFAARGMAMDIAQEYGGEGVHVAHVMIDGQIGGSGAQERSPERDPETFLDPDRMAETYWHLIEQDDPSTQPFEVHITNGPQTTEFL